MCTIILEWKTHKNVPLLVGLNRDEFFSRPSREVHRWPGDRQLVAGKDLVSGGAWFACGKNLFVAVTNDRQGHNSPAGKSSRGSLVVDISQQENIAAASEALQTINGANYGGFHILVADKENCFYANNRQKKLSLLEIQPGNHILGNYGLDESFDPVVPVLQAELEKKQANKVTIEEEISRFKSLLAQHGEGYPCVHISENDMKGIADGSARSSYGTRSSAVAAWGESFAHLSLSAGPPCAGMWQDATELLSGLWTAEDR